MLEIKNKILAPFLLTIISLLLSIGVATTVSASSIYNNLPSTTYTSDYYSEDFDTKLNDLVSSGIISQPQSSTILDMYYTYEITTKQDMKNQLDILVAKETITQDQEYSILNLFIDLNSNYEISSLPNGSLNQVLIN